MSTFPLPRTLSRVFQNKNAALAAEVAFLVLLGMLAVTLHAKLRIPMHLPGKQGILFVAMVVTGRGISRMPFASSITCAGSALLIMTNWLGFHDPFMALTCILLGAVMDVIYGIASRFSEKPWLLALASGIAWMFIPLFRLFLSLFAPMPLNMFSSGIAYPFLTHLLFGFTGGLMGAGVVSLFRFKK